MTQRIAILDSNNKVTNIGAYPDEFVPDGVTRVPATPTVQVGDTWRNGIFVSGPPEQPPLDEPVILAIRLIANIMGGDTPALVDAQLARHR